MSDPVLKRFVKELLGPEPACRRPGACSRNRTEIAKIRDKFDAQCRRQLRAI
jgi:hypothetical protein